MKQEASKKKYGTLLHLSVSFSMVCSTCSNIVIIYPLKRNKYILYIILPFFLFPGFSESLGFYLTSYYIIVKLLFIKLLSISQTVCRSYYIPVLPVIIPCTGSRNRLYPVPIYGIIVVVYALLHPFETDFPQ